MNCFENIGLYDWANKSYSENLPDGFDAHKAARLPNETFEAYKIRRKQEQKETAARLMWSVGEMSVPHNRNKIYKLSRVDYRKMKNTAQKEYKKAKEQGYSDTEILDSLYSGIGSQMMYAKFLENEIVGKI